MTAQSRLGRRPRRRLSHALSVAVFGVFGVFLLSIAVTAALQLEQNASFRRIFEADFGQAVAAADLVREAETLNGQILERALGIQRNDSELSLLDVPEIAIFRDRVAALRNRHDVDDASVALIERLIGPYLDGVRGLDAELRLERDLLNQRENLVDDLVAFTLAVEKQHVLPPAVTGNALAVLAQSSALLAVTGPGQGRRLRAEIEVLRNALTDKAAALSVTPAAAELLVKIDRVAVRTVEIQATLLNTRQRALAMLRNVRKSAQQINGAAFGDYQQRWQSTLLAMTRHAARASTTLILMLVLAGSSIGLTIWLISFIARRVTRRLDTLNDVMADHVKGLRPPIPVDGDDEITHMGRAFAVFVQARDNAEADLAEAAVTDALSRLGNRRGFDIRLENEWRRCTRDHLPLTLVMADIDHFKRYNDHYGHPQGDECIRQVGGVFNRAVHRPADFVARYGGEEFVCILPATDRDGALSIAQAIRQGIADLKLEHQAAPENGGRITLSIGLASLVPADDISPQYLIDQADAALYQAKNGGRDRICEAAIAAADVESA